MNRLIFGALSILLFLGCSMNQAPIYNVENSPIETYDGKPVALGEVEKAIIKSGKELGWSMKRVKPGVIIGTLSVRSHMAKVEIKFDTKSFNIRLISSENLNQEDNLIHKNYNSWVRNLEKKISLNIE